MTEYLITVSYHQAGRALIVPSPFVNTVGFWYLPLEISVSRVEITFMRLLGKKNSPVVTKESGNRA